MTDRLNFITIKRFAFLLIILGFILAIWFLWAGKYIHLSIVPSPDKASEIQPFMTGLVAPLFTLAGTLLIFENLRNQTNQQLSNTFFGLLNLHHKIIENIREEVSGLSTNGGMSIGREFFDDLAFRIYIDFYETDVQIKEDNGAITNVSVIKDSSYDGKIGIERLVAIYFYYFHLYHSSLGHYFRNLFHIVKYIDNSKLHKKEKINFIKMLRAQLSNYEILLLAYNGLSEYGEGFKPLIEQYELLKNLNCEDNLSASYIKRIVDLNIWADQYPHLIKIYKNRIKAQQQALSTTVANSPAPENKSIDAD